MTERTLHLVGFLINTAILKICHIRTTQANVLTNNRSHKSEGITIAATKKFPHSLDAMNLYFLATSHNKY